MLYAVKMSIIPTSVTGQRQFYNDMLYGIFPCHKAETSSNRVIRRTRDRVDDHVIYAITLDIKLASALCGFHNMGRIQYAMG